MLPRSTQTLTGRIHFVSIWPFSQGELSATRETFLDVAVKDPDRVATGMRTGISYEEYAERICAGGMPVAIRSGRGRNRWFDDYATSALQRDVAAISSLRRGAELPTRFARLAGQTAQPLNITAAAKAVDLDVSTARSYITLLETFVVGELLKQASWSENASALGHWRTHDGQEVDLVVERDDGSVTGFEVKAARNIERKDASGLVALRDTLGDQFNAGYILTTGDAAYRLDDRIYVGPVDRLWQANATTATAARP